MIKKTLTLVASVLMISGAWGEEYIDSRDGNITFTVNNSVTQNPGTLGTQSVEYTYEYTSGEQNILCTSNTVTPTTGYVVRKKLIPYSIYVEASEVDLSSNNLDSEDYLSEEITNGIDDDAIPYAVQGEILDGNDIIDSNLYTIYKNACSKKYCISGKTAKLKKYTKDSDSNDILDNMYYCLKNGSVIAITYLYIKEIISTKKTGKTYYDVISLPGNLLHSNITSLNISSTISSIDNAAFANVSASLTSITATGNFITENGVLYNSTKTRILYVLPNAAALTNGVFNIPATVTTIDPYAFKNVSGKTIVLNSNVSSYTGAGNSNNTFIGNTLAEGSVTSLMLSNGQYTLPATITTISDGAFKNATELTSVSCANNSRFSYTDGILYNADKTKVILITSQAGKTINLLASVTTIADYALQNVTGVTVNTTNNITTGTHNGTDNTINKPETLTISNYVVSGKLAKSNLSAFKSQLNAGTSYDCTGVTVLEQIEITDLPTNCLLFFGKTNLVSGINVVYTNSDNKKVCNECVIYDGTSYVNQISDFSATTSKLVRSFTKDRWGTICAPIAIASISNNFKVYNLNKFEGNYLSFNRTYATNANTPYLIIPTIDQTEISGGDNATIKMSNAGSTSAGNATFTGLYSQYNITSESNVYGFTSAGKFARATNGATFPAYRAYFTITASAPSLNAIFYDEDGNEIEFESSTNDIDAIEVVNDNNNIYDLNGNLINEISSPGMYINNGKKIIVK